MTGKIPGIIISMAGEDWIVPPLTLGQLRRLMPKIKELKDIGAGMGSEQIETMSEVVTAAMGRNYPELTADQVENELLDLGNAGEVLTAILSGSGLRRSGESPAVVSSAGQTSMVSLPPPADTASPPSTS